MFDQSSESTSEAYVESSSVPAWQRLHGEMKSATRRRCAWDAENARHLREAEAMQLWTHFGHTSILEYLEREHGVEPRVAHDRLRVSHALGELPLMEADLEDGTLQYSHVKELTRVVTPETEEDWLRAARGKTCAEVQAMVAGRKKGDGPDDDDQPDLRLRRMMVEMTPQMIAMFRELRAAIEIELGHRVEEIEIWRIVLERARGCPEGPSTPAQISICSHCDRGWQDGGGFRAELDAAEIATARCDGEELGSVDGEAGRKRVTLTEKKRRRILARHHHRCAVPGCRNARYLDVHHIVHQEDGGGHEDANLVALCDSHHRMHHRGALAIEGKAPDAIRFRFVRAHVGTNERHAAFSEAAVRTQARDALVGLGWKSAIASAAVAEAYAEVGTDAAIDVVIREALRRCPRPT